MAQATAAVYTPFIENQIVGPQIDFDTDTIKVMLVTNGYVFDPAHEFRSSITNEAVGDNYVAGGETLTGVNVVTASNTTNVFADDTTWLSTGGTPFTFRAAVVYKDTGNPATDLVISYHNFGENLDNNGTDIVLGWSTNAIVAYAALTVSQELADLTDVNTSTPTNRNALLADGVDWESRPIVEADISDLQAYLLDITGENLNDLADVVITTPADNELLAFDIGSGDWINQTPAQAGIITELSQDTTPQLGGTLDVNNNIINNSGTGNVTLGNFVFDADQVVGAGQDNYVLTYDDISGAISLEPLASTVNELSDLSDVNTSTPTNRNVLVADGVDWESRPLVEADISDLQSYLTSFDVVQDTTPQLGGNLDVNGQAIVSALNGNVTITPDGTGNTVIGANQLIAPIGSASAPTYTFAGDTDTGLYWTAGSGPGFEEVVIAADGQEACAFRTSGIRNYNTAGTIFLNIGATQTGNDFTYITRIPTNMTAIGQWRYPNNNPVSGGGAAENLVLKTGDGAGGSGETTWGMITDGDIDAEGAAAGLVLTSNGGSGVGSVSWGASPVNNWLTANSGSDFLSAPSTTGTNAIALGNSAAANDGETIAIGSSTNANFTGAIAIGQSSTANNTNTIAFGNTATAYGSSDIAIGSSSSTDQSTAGVGNNNTLIGNSSNYIISSLCQNSILIGNSGIINDNGQGIISSIAIGDSAQVNAINSIGSAGQQIAIGNSAQTSNNQGIAIGGDANVSAEGGIGIGIQSGMGPNARRSVVIGYQSSDGSSSGSSIVIGNALTGIGDNAISIGKGEGFFGNAGALGNDAVSIGARTLANGTSSVAIGATSSTTTEAGSANDIAIGPNTSTGVFTNGSNVAIGNDATTSSDQGIAIGTANNAALDAIAIGTTAFASDYAVCIGNGTSANPEGVAIGRSANAVDGAVAIGLSATAVNDDTVVIGVSSNNSSGGKVVIGNGMSGSFGQTVLIGDNADGVDIQLNNTGVHSISGSAAQYVLPSYTVATAPTGTTGGMAYFTDGDAGSPCAAVYDGASWKRIVLGATISAT